MVLEATAVSLEHEDSKSDGLVGYELQGTHFTNHAAMVTDLRAVFTRQCAAHQVTP